MEPTLNKSTQPNITTSKEFDNDTIFPNSNSSIATVRLVFVKIMKATYVHVSKVKRSILYKTVSFNRYKTQMKILIVFILVFWRYNKKKENVHNILCE